jgi:prenyltransferase beta subunit
MNRLKNIEKLARKGAEGLDAEAREAIIQAILQRNQADGGQSDLSGSRSDPYYSLFAWFCLRALQDSAPVALERYFKTCTCKSPVDLYSASFVNLQGLPVFKRKLACLGFLLRHPPRTPYSLLLSGLLAETAFPSLTPLLLKFIRLSGERSISTSRLAAQIITNHNSNNNLQLKNILLNRHSPSGGFSSADGTAPDLLATAAAHVALGYDCLDTRNDLLFTEACWAPNGLFAPLPGLPEGDVEHTFYALLVLGSCRREQNKAVSK